MSIVTRPGAISVEEYLQQELTSEVRREYLAGETFTMVAAEVNHKRIVRNIMRLLGKQLEGTACEEFGPSMSGLR